MSEVFRYPLFNKDLIDVKLEEIMTNVMYIVSTIHSLRKNNNIKIRQPLAKVMFFSKDDLSYISDYKSVILSETNIKELQILNNYSEYFSYRVKPNFKLLGVKYKDLMNKISSEVKNFGCKEVDILLNSGKIDLNCGVCLLADECVFDLVPNDNICIGNYKGIIIAIDNKITPELNSERIARDFVNLIQNYRKNNSFNVDDRMEILLFSDNKNVISSLLDNSGFINDILLCDRLECSENVVDGFELIEFEDSHIYVKVKRIILV